MNNKQIASDFLFRYNQHPDNISIDEVTNNMIQEMIRGLNNESSSLLMIPTYLSTEGEVPLNQPAIAIDAGGTNLRIGLVTLTNEGMKVEHLHKQKMFGVEKQYTFDQFIEELSKLIVPLLQYTDKVGFCFSFACEILPNKDGKVIGFNKDVKISDSEGKILCERIRQQLAKLGVNKETHFVVLNDTVSTLLGGQNDSNTSEIDGQIGLILGTGTNTAYSENIDEIKKVNEFASSKMIINMESGGFDKYPRGEFDVLVDEKSSNKGDHYFEKGISGNYLGRIVYETLKHASQDKLFSNNAKFDQLKDLTLVDVDAFLRSPGQNDVISSYCGNKDDVDLVYQLVDMTLERASKLVTSNLSACVIKMDGGKRITTPCQIVAEGSAFLKCYSYRDKVEYYMHEYLVHQKHRYYFFTTDEDVNLAGSAEAILLNAK